MSLEISDSLGSSKLSLKMTGLDQISVVPYMLILLTLKDVLEKKEPNIITTGKLSCMRYWALWGP